MTNFAQSTVVKLVIHWHISLHLFFIQIKIQFLLKLMKRTDNTLFIILTKLFSANPKKVELLRELFKTAKKLKTMTYKNKIFSAFPHRSRSI